MPSSHRLSRSRYIISTASLALAAISRAETPTDIGGLLESIRAGAEIPGIAAVVLRGDQIVAQGVAGVRAKGSPQAVTIDDHFHLGSDTKAMTATLVAVLVEEGRLKWDTTIGDVFASRVEKMDPAWKDVTIDQLLAHRGGAPADLDADGLWSRLWQRKGTPSEQRMELVRGVLARPPAAKPGTTFIYSNAGFAITGAMAETVTGQPWEDLMREKLFKPLGITTAGFGAPGMPGALDQPLGHDTDGNPVPVGPRVDNPPAIGPAGTASMSVPDWARFVSLHLLGDPSNPHRTVKLISADSFVHLHTPAPGPGKQYMAGWGMVQRDWAKGATPGAKGLTLTHAGSNTMWFCVAWLAPERDLAVLVACNRGGDAAGKACERAVAALLKQFNTAP